MNEQEEFEFRLRLEKERVGHGVFGGRGDTSLIEDYAPAVNRLSQFLGQGAQKTVYGMANLFDKVAGNISGRILKNIPDIKFPGQAAPEPITEKPFPALNTTGFIQPEKFSEHALEFVGGMATGGPEMRLFNQGAELALPLISKPIAGLTRKITTPLKDFLRKQARPLLDAEIVRSAKARLSDMANKTVNNVVEVFDNTKKVVTEAVGKFRPLIEGNLNALKQKVSSQFDSFTKGNAAKILINTSNPETAGILKQVKDLGYLTSNADKTILDYLTQYGIKAPIETTVEPVTVAQLHAIKQKIRYKALGILHGSDSALMESTGIPQMKLADEIVEVINDTLGDNAYKLADSNYTKFMELKNLTQKKLGNISVISGTGIRSNIKDKIANLIKENGGNVEPEDILRLTDEEHQILSSQIDLMEQFGFKGAEQLRSDVNKYLMSAYDEKNLEQMVDVLGKLSKKGDIAESSIESLINASTKKGSILYGDKSIGLMKKELETIRRFSGSTLQAPKVGELLTLSIISGFLTANPATRPLGIGANAVLAYLMVSKYKPDLAYHAIQVADKLLPKIIAVKNVAEPNKIALVRAIMSYKAQAMQSAAPIDTSQ